MNVNAQRYLWESAECWHDSNICIWHASEIGFPACWHWFQTHGERTCQEGVSLVFPLNVQLGRHHNVLHIQFPVFKSDTQVLFSFSLYQTEYDNVTWELLDEKISMVPSAFFAEEMNWTVGAGFGTNTAYIIMKSSSFFRSEKLCIENGVFKPNWIRNGGYFVRYLSNFTVCVFVWVCVHLLERCRILKPSLRSYQY